MALFQGDELVDVTTPDGRTLKLPRSIVPASMLPQQQIAPAPLAPDVNGAPGALAPAPELTAPPTPSVTGGMLPTVEDQASPPAGAQPDLAPVPVQSLAPGVGKGKPGDLARSNKAFDKQQATQAAAANTPDAKLQAANAQTQGAYADEGDAVAQQGDIDAAGQLVVADAYKTRNENLDKLFTQRQQQATADLEAQNQKIAEMESLKKKIAGAKIDRNADHPILGIIGIALAGLGSAMQHRYDGQAPDMTALKLFYQSIDRKVAGQMADLDQQKTILGMTKDELQTLKDKASSRLALNNLLISGESERTARQIEEVAARSSSDKVKVQAAQLAAQIRQRAGEKSMEAVQAQLTFDQREKFQKQDMGYKYASLGEQKTEHADEIAVKREEIAKDLEIALAQENARSGDASMKMMFEMQKDNETRGIANVATGEPLLNKAGLDMMKQADAYDAKAAQVEAAKGPMGVLTSEQQQLANALRQKAQGLRGEARIKYTFRERDPVQAGKVSDQYNAGQQIVSLVDDIKQMYDDKGRSFASTDEKRAAIQAKVTELTMQLKTAWQLGVLSKQDLNTISQATGGDPTGYDAGVVMHKLGLDLGQDPEAFKGRLDTLADDTEKAVWGKLKADQYDGPSEGLFHRKTAPENSTARKAIRTLEQEKTPLETEQSIRDSGKGVLGKVRTGAQAVFYLTTPNHEADKAQQEGSITHPGLTDNQAKALDTLLSSYQSGNKRDGDLLVQQVINTRPGLAISLMHSLRDEAPDLYAKARQSVSKPVADQLDYEEQSQIGASLMPTSILVQQVLTNPGDEKGTKELVRRATTGKDKEAQAALKDIVMSKNGKR